MGASDYRLQNLIDGLSAIAASPEDKQFINYNFILTIDEVFSTEPLDWLRSLVNDGVLPKHFANEVETLYRGINEFIPQFTELLLMNKFHLNRASSD